MGGGREKGLTFLLIFILSPLEIVSGKKNKNPLRVLFQFFHTIFINPDIYIILYISNTSQMWECSHFHKHKWHWGVGLAWDGCWSLSWFPQLDMAEWEYCHVTLSACGIGLITSFTPPPWLVFGKFF